VVPSLQQPAKLFRYTDGGQETAHELDPRTLGIERDTRAVPVPEVLQRRERRVGGAEGPTRDALVYGAAIALWHLGRAPDLAAAAERAREAIDGGAALTRLRAGG